ncbi:flagellar hook capping FlgD N-terminal domain-containing protein [Patulibacter defluvii]|uniref:flagellar hook capping FlgD N-terminal domain-containing protein n=1 Tax=Patulibacter defluvii TaxID=3095358 RepID=UPI002A74A8A0|nr:flagellar hook capping FlgD N-terminal domain-containing protein [Patulibacter sp. DM4]
MTSIPPAASTVGATTTATTNAATKPKGDGLGKDAFLKLMVTQLRRQDPMNPVDDSAFLAQTAQFSTLEQISNVADLAALQLNAQASSQALALVGRTATYTAADGSVRSGVVERVTFEDGAPRLTIGGVAGVSPGAVTAVGDPPATTPTATTTDSDPEGGIR